MASKTCLHCLKPFEVTQYSHHNRRYCSDECRARKISKITSTFFQDHKEDYLDKLYPYPESETGRAYIGIAKTPLMPAAEQGHGFQGVLLQDENRQFVQCHACGQWLKRLAFAHLQKCSGLTPKIYKETYGLSRRTGLVSDELAYGHQKKIIESGQLTRLRTPEQMAAMRTKIPVKAFIPKSMEFRNEHETCPEQLKSRTFEFLRVNQEFPSQSNRGASLAQVLYRRFGSINHALTSFGLPIIRKYNGLITLYFSDGTQGKFNYLSWPDRGAMMRLLSEKCPQLQLT